MWSFDLKKHNERVMNMTKRARKGIYPSPKAAKVGSSIGTATGVILTIAGLIGMAANVKWGLGSFLAGIVTIISNIMNLIRIKSYLRT